MSDLGPAAHLSICIDGSDRITFYPSGDKERIARALKTLIELFRNRPKAMLCAAGVCGDRHEEKPN
jgi:hypothetical protein